MLLSQGLGVFDLACSGAGVTHSGSARLTEAANACFCIWASVRDRSGFTFKDMPGARSIAVALSSQLRFATRSLNSL